MKRVLAYCVAAALAASVGCSRVKPPIEGRMDPYAPSQIHFADEDLRSRTAVGRPIAERDPAGLLRVTVPIRAASSRNLFVDYRVTFFDATGSPLGPATGWTTKRLESNVPDQITFNSTTPRAADFQLDLRYAR